jgi:hypothetical protein
MISSDEMKAFAALDLTPIKMKLMHVESGESWSLEKTNAVEVEYRRFLFLMKKYPDEQAAPSVQVDTFWHYHILDTMKYARDCQQAFGYFLHHYPYVGLDSDSTEADQQRAGDRMQELYRANFGAEDSSPVAGAAWCGVTVQAAWCGIAVAGTTEQAGIVAAAWCGIVTDKQHPANVDGVATARSGACGQAGNASQRAAPDGTAWCGVASKAAWCGVATKSAWCGVSFKPEQRGPAVVATKQAAANNPAWCGIAAKTAWCGVAGSARQPDSLAPLAA